MKLTHVSVVIGFLLSQSLYAESYKYPELEVVPRASARLAAEAKGEESKVWTAHIPVQVSALFTITAGLVAGQDEVKKKDGSKDTGKQDTLDGASQVALGVGSGWLLATVVTSATYRPYKTCYSNIARMKVTNNRGQLARERAAEECLEAPARLASRINLLSSATNFLASAFVVAAADDDMTAAVGGVAAVAAFAPYLFQYHWQDVADYHSEYKKRIYGPITGLGFARPTHRGALIPTLTLSVSI